jgi:IS605 OrfB family transposase
MPQGSPTSMTLAEHAPWPQIQQQRRRTARQRSRRIVGSRGHRQASAKLAALDRRAANLRSHQTHTLTTAAARRYGIIVVEDLDVAAMGRSMGRRAFRRSVYQAGIGKVRPMLGYKCAQQGGRLLVADRWFASSKTHHGCGGYLADLRLDQRGGVAAPAPCVGDHGGQARAVRGRARSQKSILVVAGADDARTNPPLGERNPEQGYLPASTYNCSLN